MKLRSSTWLAVTALAVSGLGAALPATTASAAPATRTTTAATATRAPLGQAAVAPALAHLRARAADFGLTAADLDGLAVDSVVPSQGNGLTTVWFQQRVGGIPITHARVNVAVRADGSVLRVASGAIKDAASLVTAKSPRLSDTEAAAAAARSLGLEPTGSFESSARAAGAVRARTLDPAGISRDPIPVALAYQSAGKGLALVWNVTVNQLDGEHWWQVAVDAADGAEVARYDYVAEDSHDVFAFPTEAPSFGNRTLVTNPAWATASPFGWNDTNGAAGAESTLTQGNNVKAYTDTNADDAPDAGSLPDGGAGLAFDFPLDLGNEPSTYRPAAVSNLYYANNRIHDIMYRYGFTEASGNFQVNNYGKGGAGGDAVNAEAQDGEGLNNANFGTPPDGAAPRMQMFVWDQTTPKVDGDLDNGIIIHEYGHGISNRLTGGGDVSCLQNEEQGGEGWSDFLSLAMTQTSGTEAVAGRGIGTYALGEPTSGPGIRQQKYSTDLAVNDHTYDDIKSMAVPHGVGEVWATMLWDLYWNLVEQDGWSANLVTGNAGNTKAMQLVTDGLKLNPCSPGFVDARDAILAADEADYAGANQCLIWETFARRGLGFSASQGSSDSADDGTEAFDLPPACSAIALSSTVSPDPIPGGSEATYTLAATNNSDVRRTGNVLTSALGATTTYVAGSATCAGTYTAASRTVRFVINNLAAGATRTCTFRVTAQTSPVSTTTFTDDFEPNLSAWQPTHGAGTVDWSLSTTTAHSPTRSAFASEPGVVSDQYLRTTAPLGVLAGDALSFWQDRDTENNFDGGVVEVSRNGGSTWADIGAGAFTQNGYTTAAISSQYGSPIAGRPAFTGSSDGWQQSVADLSAYAGESVLIRFRAASDTSVGGNGWYVDDVSVGRSVVATNRLVLTVPGQPTQTSDVVTPIVAPTPPAAPTLTGVTPVGGGARVAFTANGAGTSPITGYTAGCTSTDGGANKSATGAASPLTVNGLTVGKSYRCRVRATSAAGSGPYSPYGAPFVAVATAPPAPRVTVTAALTTGLRVSFASNGTGGSPITRWTALCSSTTGGTARSVSGTASPLTVTGATSGATYRCRVRGVNAIGAGAYSSPGSPVVAR